MKIKYTYTPAPGRLYTQVLQWDDHYGNLDMNKYRFGFQSGTLLRGQAAYDKLTQPLNEQGETFLDMIPDLTPPPDSIPNPNYGIDGDYRAVIPNPEYLELMQVYNYNLAVYRMLLTDFLQLICRVTFPPVPDSVPGIKWYEWMNSVKVGSISLSDGGWVRVPVVIGNTREAPNG